MRTYKVTAKRWEHGWELHIEGVGVTQSRGVADAEDMVRHYIELEGVNEPFAVDIDFRAEDDLDADIREARRAAIAAAKAQEVSIHGPPNGGCCAAQLLDQSTAGSKLKYA